MHKEFKYNGHLVRAIEEVGKTGTYNWIGVPIHHAGWFLWSKDIRELMNSIDQCQFFWHYPVAPTAQPTTYDGKIPVPETEQTTPSNPHPLEPKPEKPCTCGASSCGHSGHSSWCDSLE